MKRRADSGLALVQVLIMSILLITLAAGVMRMVFGTHVLISRQVTGDEKKAWVEACQAWRNETWAGIPCKAGQTSCDYTGQGGPTIGIACTGPDGNGNTKIKYTVTWN